MRLSRVVIRNFRSFELLDVPLNEATTCVIGENNMLAIIAGRRGRRLT
jgi:putative ATP-dependent endonuclease of the OLD family